MYISRKAEQWSKKMHQKEAASYLVCFEVYIGEVKEHRSEHMAQSPKCFLKDWRMRSNERKLPGDVEEGLYRRRRMVRH